MPPHSLLNEIVSSEDLKLFEVYCNKHLAVGNHLHSWMRIGLAANAGLLAIAAFVARPPGEERTIWPLGALEALALLALAIAAVFYCYRWRAGYLDMSAWQTRTNAVLRACEKGLLKPEFLTDGASTQPAQSLERPAMWHMINAYQPPGPERTKTDVVDYMTAVPVISMCLWVAVAIGALLSVALRLRSCGL